MARATLVLAAALVATAVATPAGAGPTPAGYWTLTRPGMGGAVDMFRDGTTIATMHLDAERAAVVRSTDFGVTWTPATHPGGGYVEMGTPTVGWTVDANECVNDVCDRAVFRTTDGARTWRPVTPLPAPPRGTHQVGQRYAAAPGGRMLVAEANRYPKSAACPSGRLAHTAAEIFVTRDGGRSWSHSRLPRNGVILDFHLYDERHGVLNVWEKEYLPGACFDAPPITGRSAVWVTHDGARTWQRTPVQCQTSCQGLVMASPKRILVGAHWGVVHISEDGGRTFRQTAALPGVPADPTGLPAIGAFAFPTPDVGYAIAFPQGILRTTDGGATWSPEPSPYAPVLGPHELAAADPRHAVAAVGTGLLTRTDVSPTPPRN